MFSKKILLLFITLISIFNAFAQEKFTISGIISDSKNNETLIGVNISANSSTAKATATTNEYGFYSITLPKGEYQLNISYVGFQTLEKIISLAQNTKTNFSLTSVGEDLEEVVITEKTTTNTRRAEMSVNKLSIATIKKMPVVLGEVDKQYSSKGFVIVGFPANNFASQEPGTNEEIAAFCQLNYGVTFPMMDKVSVKGDDMCAVYQFLTQKSKNGLQDSEVEWNFQKYLINEKGELEKVISPKMLPTDPEVINWIKA